MGGMHRLASFLIPLGAVAMLYAAHRGFGWPGVAFAATAIVMWLLLHVTRTLHVLRRTAERPVGYVPSAVMLNARLRAGMRLLHVVAMTRALGVLQSPEDTQPEVFRWTDEGGSHVTATFTDGRLTLWRLERPEVAP